MPRTEEDALFEEEQSKLAGFLRGQPLTAEITDQDLAAWHKARVMLSAPELLQACEYALTLLRGLSTEEFSAGGDRPARDRLAVAICSAKDGDRAPESLVSRCAEDVKEAIRLNRASTL
jgi:hypothetical protein